MARNEWSRWGRGSCEGYSLDIGDGGFTRFLGQVVRNVTARDGEPNAWSSSITGACSQPHPSRVQAMKRVEFELACTAEMFVSMYAGYKAHRHENRYSCEVDALTPGGPV